jgi:hypothetical protein
MMAAAKLAALGDAVARAWKRDALKVRGDSASARSHTNERGRAIQAAIKDRDFEGALDAMGSAVGSSQWLLIERAFSMMTELERATCLRRVWRESKVRMPPTRALRLFRQATLLRNTVPPALPTEVPVYRGAWSTEWRQGRRRARNGLSWTTDRDVALAFAELPLYSLQRFLRGAEDETGGLIIGAKGCCLASATVPRAAVLAYFHDEAAGFYHEHECIVDPSTIKHITYERAETTKEKQ